MFFDADEVHISVTFKGDLKEAERLERAWRKRQAAPVYVGGPATGEAGGDFVPGRYLKHGAVITSRGCPNRCPHCSVPKREGAGVRELPVTWGWNVLDDNLLACSRQHIEQVFSMLHAQKHQPSFTGGLEAARLKPWHVELLAKRPPESMFFAYDTPGDLEPLREAGKLLRRPGLGLSKDGKAIANRARCYVLCGFFRGDTPEKAARRMVDTVEAGFWPMAMVYQPEDAGADYVVPDEWVKVQRHWTRLAAVKAECAKLRGTP